MGGTGFGTETAAVCATGLGHPTATAYTNTEIYDGTSWTEVNNIQTARAYLAGCGITTAGLAIGGYTPGGSRLKNVELYDGTSWTDTGELVNAFNSLGAAAQGTTSSALAFSGYRSPGGPSDRTEEFDGTSWTEVGNLNNSRANATGAGNEPAALCIGGEPGATNLAAVESWNGSTWTETSYDLGTGRYYAAACGSATNALVFGGTPPTSSATEELAAATEVKTFTSS